MLEVLETKIRKKSKANAVGIILALAIVCGVFLGVNVFVGPKGPMPGLTIPFLVGTLLLFGLWFFMNDRLKNKMTMSMDKNGDYYINAPLKEGGKIVLDKISAIEPFFARVYLGKGPRVKEIYLKIYDESGHNGLTLYHSLGAIHEDPDEFFEIEDMQLGGYQKGDFVYASKDIQEIYYTLKEGKFITIKQPTGL